MKVGHAFIWFSVFLLMAFLSGRISLPIQSHVDPSLGPRGTAAKKITLYDDSVQAKMDSVVFRLRKLLERIHPDSLECFDKPATDDQIAELEDALGYPLPAELKAFFKVVQGKTNTKTDGIVNSTWAFFDLVGAHTWTDDAMVWLSAEEEMPRPENHGFGPGFVMFATNDYEFLGVYVEDGKVYELNPESGMEVHSSSLVKWLENICDRLEGGLYSNDGEFELWSESKRGLVSPGQE